MIGTTPLGLLTLLLLGLISALWTTTASAADLEGKRIDALAQPYLESETVVGMSIGVIQGDQTIVRGYGQLAADDPRKPDEKTIYEIGSVTKTFTGLLLADAVVKGEVELDMPIRIAFTSAIDVPQLEKEAPIRLVHLATHTSGLPRMPDNINPADPNNPYADYDEALLLDFLQKHRLQKSPGQAIAYSNLGAGLLGTLLAAQLQTKYATLLENRIAKPLAMHDTRIALTDSQQSRLAPPLYGDGTPGHAWDFDALAGAGAIRSDVSDLLKYAQAYLDPPQGKLGEAIEIAWKRRQQPIKKSDFAMGLGWHIAHDGQTRFHSGQTGGYHSAIFINRQLNVAVVVLANTATTEIDALAEQLVRLAAGAEEEPREFPQYAKVSAADVKRLAGQYQLAPGFVFAVTAEGTKLMVGLTGQTTHPVYPNSETEWRYKVVDATLTFQLDESGKCTAVELLQNGVRQTANRIK
ncbi:serine hydrolase [Blastopirellula retiformator]|nr:serine hydrolase [Blastopirellula retiformator]